MAKDEVKKEGVWGALGKLGEGVKGVVIGGGDSKGKGKELDTKGSNAAGEEGWVDIIGDKLR